LGVFGALVTLGLFAYEILGIKKCHGLMAAGRRIEMLWGVENGQFKTRPQKVARIVNEPFAAGIIYPTVLAAWTFFAFAFVWPEGNPCVPLLLLAAGLAATLVFDELLKRADAKGANAPEASGSSETRESGGRPTPIRPPVVK